MTTQRVRQKRHQRRMDLTLFHDQDEVHVEEHEYAVVEDWSPALRNRLWSRRRNPIRSTNEAPVTDDVIDDWFLALAEEATTEGATLSKQVLDEAKRIVRGLRKELPLNTDIYPMDEGKVAIELYGAFGHGFLLVCEPGGSALCIVTVGGVSRRARYDNSTGLPDGFLHEGLRDVRPDA